MRGRIETGPTSVAVTTMIIPVLRRPIRAMGAGMLCRAGWAFPAGRLWGLAANA
ncbi:MAG: hypothetical protein Q4G25_04470 [Paracoccus sp. (in: a-proteobacteria)]|nr:hypothetical protein [Paracoccus sp. (in: a-proteobacteria)]